MCRTMSWLALFATFMDFGQAWDFNTSEYDCDGDGTQDCGKWDYAKVQCNNVPKCGHQFKVGDYTLDHSCRCMKCFDEPDSAAAEAPYASETKGMFYSRWRGWNHLYDSCAPWLMPKSDADLQAILSYAKARKFTVRPSGATHSAGPLVTDAGNQSKNTLAVSLAEYTAPDDWEYVLDTSNPDKVTVKVNAGWTQLQLYQKVRPLGYFLPTQTAGPVFQLSGMVANSVHGGNTDKGFLHQYVLSMRVMLHDGTSKVIEDENELKFWRNSFGLLGVITGLEFSLDRREKFQQYWTTWDSVPWTQDDFWTTLKEEAHLNVPSEVINLGKDGDRKALMSQFFLDPYTIMETGNLRMTSITWRVDENATESYSTKVPSESDYNAQMTDRVLDEILTDNPQNGQAPVHTYEDFSEAVRHWGGPNVLPGGLRINELLATNARTMTSLAQDGPGMNLRINRESMNDGFYAYKVPQVVFSSYFIPPENLFKAMDVLAKSYKDHDNSDAFEWNAPAELRFITVSDDAVLNPVPAGAWANVEFMAFPINGKPDQGWKSAFMEVEKEWEKLGAKPHLGKFWGFEENGGTVEPYQPSQACKIYSDAQKTTFNEYRQQVDPDGLFAGGSAMLLLAPCLPLI